METRINDINEVNSKTPFFILTLWLLSTTTLWVLAFYKPVNSKEWLDVFQAVCFGTTESGLPETYGWIILIFTPLSLLFVYGVAYLETIIIFFKCKKNYILKLIFSIIFICCFSQSFWINAEIKDRLLVKNQTFDFSTSEDFPLNYPVSDITPKYFKLVNQYGKEVTLDQYKGKVIILSFIFAHCKTMCPAILHSLDNGTKDLLKDDYIVLLVTLDPWRDTPRSLPGYSKRLELTSNQYILSGSVEQVSSVLNDYQIPTSRDLKSGDIAHPAIAYIISKEGKIIYTLNNPSSKWINSSVKKLL